MYLKIVPFNMALLALGCFENADAARLVGLNTKTVERAREGGAVSGDFIGNSMAAFRLNADRITEKGLKVAIDTFFEESTREERELAEAVA